MLPAETSDDVSATSMPEKSMFWTKDIIDFSCL